MKTDTRGFPIIPWYLLTWYRFRMFMRGHCRSSCWGNTCGKSRWPHRTHVGGYGLAWKGGKVIGASRVGDIVRAQKDPSVNDIPTHEYFASSDWKEPSFQEDPFGHTGIPAMRNHLPTCEQCDTNGHVVPDYGLLDDEDNLPPEVQMGLTPFWCTACNNTWYGRWPQQIYFTNFQEIDP